MKPWLTGGVLALLTACQPAGRDAEPERVVPFAGRELRTSMLQPQPPAGVLIVVVDALRADWVGAYGSERGLTPELDALAERSFLFENAYATSAWTRSSIGSLFTSRYPSSHTALTRDDALPERSLTLAEALEARATFWSFGVTTNPNAGSAIGFDQGFDSFDRPDPETARGYPEDAVRLIPAEAVTARALALFGEPRDDAAYVFGFVHYIDPHDPYMPHPGLLQGPEPPGTLNGSRAALNELRTLGRDGGTPETIARLHYLYAGEVRYTDRWIGALVGGLEELNLFDDLMIIITADHGESFYEHGKRGHGQSLYEIQVRVPLLIKLPGMQPGDGRRIEPPVSLVDVAPTVLHAWGLPTPADFQGNSLAPLLYGQSRDSVFDYIFFELQLNPDARRFGLRHGDWKLIRSHLVRPDGSERVIRELFQLSRDPGEMHNLAGRPEFARQQTRLEAALLQWEDEVRHQAVTAQSKPLDELDEKTLEELRGLGYVQ